MNLPNTLTVARIFLTVIFLFFVGQDGFAVKFAAAIVFLVGSATDYLDGYIARKYRLVTDFGKLMDPIADKFLMLSAFFVFMRMGLVVPWMFAVIAVREIGITAWRLIRVKRGDVLPAETLGKYKTVFQVVAAYVILFFLVFRESHFYNTFPLAARNVWLMGIDILMAVVVALTVISALQYFVQWRHVARQ